MAYVISVPIVDYIEPTDSSGVLISGIAATLQTNLFTRKPSGATFSATIAEIASTGRYTITFTPDAVSNGVPWYWSTNQESPYKRHWESYDVVTAAQADPHAALLALGLTATRVANLDLLRSTGISVVSSATTTDLEIVRGDTFVDDLTVLDGAGAAYDLTGATVWMTIKHARDYSDDDDDALVKLYWVSGGASSGIASSAPTTGVITVTLTAAQTNLLAVGRHYRYDVQTLKAGVNGTPIRGAIAVLLDATRRQTTP